METIKYNFRNVRVGRMSDNDGLEVSLAKYEEDINFQNIVRSHCMTELVLKGNRKEDEDSRLIEEIMQHCSQAKTKLAFTYVCHTLPADKIREFPLLKKLIFYCTSLVSDSLLRFNDWCPNLTEIRFRAHVSMSEEAYETFTSTDHIYPQIKTFEFDMSYNYELTREFLAAMDTKFPSLECLDLTLSHNDDFSSYEPKYQLPYEPLYFKNLKKLSVFAFGNEVNKLIDYMAVCNSKLKEFKFHGMTTPEEMITWIGSCKRLGKLTFDCSYLDEHGLMELKNMRWLREVHFEAKYLHWEPEDIVEFARNNRHLKVMTVESDRKNNSMIFDEKFKQDFGGLIQERKKLKIKVLFHQGGREIRMSETGFSETQQYDTPDEEN